MIIDSNADEEQVYTYLTAKCPFLAREYSRSAFEGIDGEVFLGLTVGTVDMIFPNLSVKDKGLLLARVEGLKFGEQSRTGTPRSSVTPIHQLAAKAPIEQKDVFFAPAPPRLVTPPLLPEPTQYREAYHPIVLPRAEELPRILLEFWRHSTTDGKEDFLAETWLPNLKEVELRSETFRLALRRCIESRNSMIGGSQIRAARKWFGALILSGRYFRVDSRLELFVMEVKEIELIGWDSDVYYFKLFSFVSGGNLNHVYTSNKLPVGNGRFNSFTSSNAVEFDEQITMKFAKAGEDSVIEPVIGALSPTGSSPTRRHRGATQVTSPKKIFTKTNPVSNVEALRAIMMRAPDKPLRLSLIHI